MRPSEEPEFAAFVRDSSSQLLTAAWLITGNHHTAEELVQEAFERVYVRWGIIRSGNPMAYTRRVMFNLRTDRWRRRRLEVLVVDLPEPTSGNVDSRHVDLVRALQTLPTREREVVVLRHYLDLSERQTADVLGVSLGTVKSSTSRGLAKLRTLMEGDGSYVPT